MPRIEPTIEPSRAAGQQGPAAGAVPGIRVEPQAPRRQEPRRGEPPPVSARRRVSLTARLCGLFLLLLALPPLAVVMLRWLPPPTTSYMLQSPVKPVKYRWVPAREIAESARRAVVASEDQKFWSHRGFDLEAIQKAEEYNRNPRHHRRGASTISQQTAKNLFLWPGGGYFRKGVEAALTVLLERVWGKQRIIEVYLNVVEFGPGVYGVEAAAQTYFNKPAARLSPAEAARLAAVLPNPRHWSVRRPGPYVQSRAAWILGQMGYGGRGTPAEEPEPPPADAIDENGDRAAGAPPASAPGDAVLPELPAAPEPPPEQAPPADGPPP